MQTLIAPNEDATAPVNATMFRRGNTHVFLEEPPGTSPPKARRIVLYPPGETVCQTSPAAPLLIIGLGGKRGAGKDAIGRLISIAWGYKRIALADTLKDEYAALNGVPRGDLDNPVTKETHRKGMQALGGLRRSEDVDYWIKQSGMTDTDELIVVTDCRMENERAAIRSLGGLTLWIANDEADAQIDTDPTESATPDEYDFVLYNDKSLPVATAFDAADLLEPLLGGRMSLHAIDAWLDTLPDL